jgi:ubiquinone/menaquinone biosynthesis C-methylase UbiE
MKIRDSGMPEEAVWNGFFDAPRILHELRLRPTAGDVVDVGCGFGTFSLAAAAMVEGTVHALDIDPVMIDVTNDRATHAGHINIKAIVRDVVAEGTGLADNSITYAMLFNILHAQEAAGLLQETFRVLRSGGIAAMIHWIHDPRTPRGPPLEIRPRPEQCCEWASAVGFRVSPAVVQLPPHHFGLVAHKP